MYVIVGASGFLGSYLIKNILSETRDEILAVDRAPRPSLFPDPRVSWAECDITNTEQVTTLSEQMRGMPHCKVAMLASYHHPDAVKKNPKLAWHINITSLAAFVNAIPEVDCLFYPSTEMVYGEGVGRPFVESDTPSPINLYGRHKVIAETIVNGYGFNVVRFPFMIGPSLIPDAPHFYDEIVETLQNGKEMMMFSDAYKSVLDFDTASRLLMLLMEHYTPQTPKILNIAGDEVLSKYQIALRIAKGRGLPEDLVRPMLNDSNQKVFTEKRALVTILSNDLLKETLRLDAIRSNL